MQPIQPSTAAVTTRNTPESAERKPEDGDAAGCSVDLPLHLTEKILCCISPLESVRLATVCKSWAATVSDRLARLVPRLFVTETALTPHNVYGHQVTRRGYVVSVPLDDGAGPGLPSAAIPAPKHLHYLVTCCRTKCIGTTRNGRLALATSEKVTFIDPVTDASQAIDLGFGANLRPRLVAGGGDAVFSHDSRRPFKLRWLAQGGEDWSKRTVARTAHQYFDSSILSAVSCSGFIYVLHEDGNMTKVDTNAPPPLRMEDLKFASLANMHFSTPRGQSHLVESKGEILFVRQLLSHKVTISRWNHHAAFLDTVGFEVYRLDVAGREWVKVEMLAGDCSLFVSPDSSFAVRATEKMGCRSNCIYFVGRYCLSHRDIGERTWGVYSMADGKVLFEHAIPSTTGTNTMAWWFRPSVV